MRHGEVYFKISMMSVCLPYCKVMCARILEPSLDLTYENNLDVPSKHVTFLYYLFAYAYTHVCVGNLFFLIVESVEQMRVCLTRCYIHPSHFTSRLA